MAKIKTLGDLFHMGQSVFRFSELAERMSDNAPPDWEEFVRLANDKFVHMAEADGSAPRESIFFNFDNNKCGNNVLVQICESFLKISAKNIAISACGSGVTDDDAAKIARLISSVPHGPQINLSLDNNNISDTGAAKLLETIYARHKSEQPGEYSTCSLSENYLTDRILDEHPTIGQLFKIDTVVECIATRSDVGADLIATQKRNAVAFYDLMRSQKRIHVAGEGAVDHDSLIDAFRTDDHKHSDSAAELYAEALYQRRNPQILPTPGDPRWWLELDTATVLEDESFKVLPRAAIDTLEAKADLETDPEWHSASAAIAPEVLLNTPAVSLVAQNVDLGGEINQGAG